MSVRRLAAALAALGAVAMAAVAAAPAALADGTTPATTPGESFVQITLSGGGIGSQPLSLPTHEGNVLVGQFLAAVLIGNPHAVPAPQTALVGQPIQVVALPKGSATPLKLQWVPRTDGTGGWWHVVPPQKLDLPSGAWDFPSDAWVPFTKQAFVIIDQRLHPEKYASVPAPAPAVKHTATGGTSLRVLLIGLLAALAAGVGVTVATRRTPRVAG